MLDKIEKVVARYHDIEQQLANPAITADHERLTELAQERSEIVELVEAYQKYKQLTQQLQESREMQEMEEDPDLVSMAGEEIDRLTWELGNLEKTMRTLLLPKDPRDEKNVYIEIRAGAGGDEAGIFAADLLRLYTRYAEVRNWKVDLMDENATGVGGYKEVILSVKGKGAYSRLKYESGVHRVQRVPKTESQGRIHTSTATVAVMPEIDDVDVTIDERDLEITPTFSSGPGGQHMQKNATAARIVHKPSGIMVKIQSERSLMQNKRLGIAIIQARLQEEAESKQNNEISADRKEQVGSGERSEKIRTYNYPQSRVTDHRVGYTSYNLQAVMDGDIDPFIDALIMAAETEKLASVKD